MDNQVMEGLQAEINFSDKLNLPCGKLEPQKDKPSMQITMRHYYWTIFLGSTAASLRDCVRKLSFWSCGAVMYSSACTLRYLLGPGVPQQDRPCNTTYLPLPTLLDGFQLPDLSVSSPAIDTPSQPGPSQLSVLSPSGKSSLPGELSEGKDFEIMVWTYPSAKKSAARKPAKKAAKPGPHTHGPISANTNATWDDSVDALAELLGTSSQFLVVSSMEWHWLKPQNSVWLPLRNESGYSSLVKQLLSPPKGVSPAHGHPKQSAGGQVHGPSGPLSGIDIPEPSWEWDEEISDDDDGPKKKKNGTSTIFGPPLSSTHFSTKAALKKKLPMASRSMLSFDPPVPQAPAQPATPYPNPYVYPAPGPYPPAMGYPPFPSYTPPGFFGHPRHMLPWQDTPRPHRLQQSQQQSPDGSSPPYHSSSKRRRQECLPDPPSSPAFSGGSLDDFLTQFPDLPGPTRSFLLELGFEIEDDLSVVTEAQWKAGGLALFSWNRIVKAYNKYKNSLRC
ncbi:hypothetical protein B0H10DRAFT_2192734 [Mycena sp. CBHHK59/15]|nr:hypothetical protein B0H10DRAFT_2192734 [Mycena sp. CBHHK59/15]